LADFVIFYHYRKKDWLRGRGLGRAMIQETIRRAREKGAKYIWGWIQPDEHTSMEYLID
jgi:L-amino acid N-acyltransferase YncA